MPHPKSRFPQPVEITRDLFYHGLEKLRGHGSLVDES